MEAKDDFRFVTNKTGWLRDICVGQTKKGYFKNWAELESVCTLISRYNRTTGLERKNKISGSRDWRDVSYTITCNKLEEYE